MAVAAAHAVEHVGLPECTYALSQAAIYLSLAPKSNSAGKALGAARAEIREHGVKSPPDALRSAAYPASRALGRGVGYEYPHDAPGHVNDQEHLPRRARAPALLRPGRERARAARPTQRDPRRPWPRSMKLAAAARTAQPLWSLLPVSARARYLRRAAVAMLDELDELAVRLAEETRWPRAQLELTELLPAAAGLRALADDGPRALADQRLMPYPWLLAGRSTRLVQSPVGVVGLRGPSASPWAEPVLETAAALLAGNAVLLGGGRRGRATARRLPARGRAGRADRAGRRRVRGGLPARVRLPAAGAAGNAAGA